MDPSGKLRDRMDWKGYRSGHMMYARNRFYCNQKITFVFLSLTITWRVPLVDGAGTFAQKIWHRATKISGTSYIKPLQRQVLPRNTRLDSELRIMRASTHARCALRSLWRCVADLPVVSRLSSIMKLSYYRSMQTRLYCDLCLARRSCDAPSSDWHC